jgi:hypothetical protein
MRSTYRLSLLLSAGMAGLLFTALPIGLDPSTLGPVVAQAWAGADNGHGSGDGHGNGNANGHANDHASVGGNASSVSGDDEASASELGALNAAHASPQALANAAPNSRVGKIAAYKNAALTAQTADQAVTDAQSAVDAATQAVADAQAALDAANTTGDPAQIAAAQSTLDAANQSLADAETNLANAQAGAATADATRDAALAAAANKPITDRVVDAVNDLLGIN